MTDHDPATLSGSLLARKGTAGVEGFSSPEVDRSRPDRSRSRTFRVAGLLMAAAAVGATGMWLTTRDRESAGTHVAVPAAVGPVAESPASVPAVEPNGRSNEPAKIQRVTTSASMQGEGPASLPVAPLAPAVAAERAEAGSQGESFPAPSEVPLRAATLTTGGSPDKPKTPTPSSHLADKRPPSVASHGFRVQLHALQSRDAVEREWARLRRRHRDLLSDKQLVIDRLDVSGTGPRYRMQLGNLPNRTAARQLCRALSDRGQKCILVPAS